MEQRELINSELKVCTRCKEGKGREEYYGRQTAKDGLHSWCKECIRDCSKQNRINNRETCIACNKRWIKKNPLKVLLIAARQRAKEKGIDFTLTAENITIPDICPVLGIPLISGQGKLNRRAAPNAPTIDRLDNTLGYTEDNARVISWRANTLKNDSSLWEMEAIVDYMRRECLNAN